MIEWKRNFTLSRCVGWNYNFKVKNWNRCLKIGVQHARLATSQEMKRHYLTRLFF